jgi:hypothetical protein
MQIFPLEHSGQYTELQPPGNTPQHYVVSRLVQCTTTQLNPADPFLGSSVSQLIQDIPRFLLDGSVPRLQEATMGPCPKTWIQSTLSNPFQAPCEIWGYSRRRLRRMLYSGMWRRVVRQFTGVWEERDAPIVVSYQTTWCLIPDDNAHPKTMLPSTLRSPKWSSGFSLSVNRMFRVC